MVGKNPKFVVNTFKKNCYDKFKTIETFVTKRESIGLPSDEIEKLKKLNKALEEQWARMEVTWDEMMGGIEDEPVLTELNTLVSTTGKAVAEVLENSEKFLKEKSAQIAKAGMPPAGGTSDAGWSKAVKLPTFWTKECELWFSKASKPRSEQ